MYFFVGVNQTGTITIFASDTNASNYHTLMYNIYGKITLENKFAFKTASLVGVHPNYGPYAGATRLTIAGTDLGIGSNVSVKIGNSYCPVVSLFSCALYKRKKQFLTHSFTFLSGGTFSLVRNLRDAFTGADRRQCDPIEAD